MDDEQLLGFDMGTVDDSETGKRIFRNWNHVDEAVRVSRVFLRLLFPPAGWTIIMKAGGIFAVIVQK